jgi:hypothetical protein
MSVQIGTATDVGNLIDLLNAFLLVGHSLDPQYAGTGNGLITALIGTAATVNETITCTATNATHFTVVGSISGALGTATVGTPFTSAVVDFTIVAGGTAFVLGDTITFVMTLPWTALVATAGAEYIWSAPGNNGAANIIVGVSRFSSSAGDYDDLNLLGAFGYDSGQSFTSQPGGNNDVYVPLLRVGSMRYWFVANGRRCAMVVQVSTTYQTMYLGFIDQYASPSQFPYPLAVGGSMSFHSTVPIVGDPLWRWSNNSISVCAFAIANNSPQDLGAQLRMRTNAGVWRGFSTDPGNTTTGTGQIWPYSGIMNNLRPNIDGSYFLDAIVVNDDGPNIYGELDGVDAVTGYNQVSENTVTINGISWLVVQNVFRTTTTDYFALKLA